MENRPCVLWYNGIGINYPSVDYAKECATLRVRRTVIPNFVQPCSIDWVENTHNDEEALLGFVKDANGKNHNLHTFTIVKEMTREQILRIQIRVLMHKIDAVKEAGGDSTTLEITALKMTRELGEITNFTFQANEPWRSNPDESKN